jgi:hypothetical protein
MILHVLFGGRRPSESFSLGVEGSGNGIKPLSANSSLVAYTPLGFAFNYPCQFFRSIFAPLLKQKIA